MKLIDGKFVIVTDGVGPRLGGRKSVFESEGRIELQGGENRFT